jgi:hypothetical protein
MASPTSPPSALTSPALTVAYSSSGSNRRWSPLSYHGLPRSPPGAFESVSSPTSIATPSTIVSHHSARSHRFDALSPAPTAYTAPSYTSSITLAPPPGGKRIKREQNSSDPEYQGSVPLGPTEEHAVSPEVETEGLCRRLFAKLGCCGGPRDRRRKAEDVLKIEPVHWTEQ